MMEKIVLYVMLFKAIVIDQFISLFFFHAQQTTNAMQEVIIVSEENDSANKLNSHCNKKISVERKAPS